ncbi:uncharacterized protein DS421_19g647120 [Arachis hypogaea]|uniref:Uncharacterized protein n=1 Tax=Arachis hypogaea TaxID=3818 RepID=A0A6B9V5Z7_ARAHY|nr:uncharacterized protein DS421_19g647120 [Arachis hypogaea]
MVISIWGSGGLVDLTPAQGAAGMRAKPPINATCVEYVLATVKLPNTLFFFELRQAYNTLCLVPSIYRTTYLVLEGNGVRLQARAAAAGELVVQIYSRWCRHVTSVTTPSKHGEAEECEGNYECSNYEYAKDDVHLFR